MSRQRGTPAGMIAEPRVARIAADLEELKKYTVPEQPFTRRAFTPIYLEARRWLSGRMVQAGLRPELDAAANLVGTRAGRLAARRPVMLGSHTDTVPGGGLYDGTAGVVAALETARLVDEAGWELPFDLQVVDFLCEEPSGFGLSCIGSQGMVGRLAPGDLSRQDPSERVLAEVIREAGGDPDRLDGALRRCGDLSAYLELHIEQGPVLEEARCRIGIVTGIAGIRRWTVRLEGHAGHAGTSPMANRRDALSGAAELISQVEAIALALAGEHFFVATVGSIQVMPGAANVVPGEASLMLEARALEDALLEEFEARFGEALQALAARRGLEASIEGQSRSSPVAMDGPLQEAIARAALALDVRSMPLPSGAGHDAAHLAAIAPAAMVFIPCRGGLSHSPAEHAEVEDIALGIQVLLGVLRALAEES